ncbi:MAG: hypothetical protein F6K26_49205 [Moorea sp. SIO2I5]|nr:hypothetical protein [Moorena sp. SIO2I5]
MQSLMGGTPKTALHRFAPYGKENCYIFFPYSLFPIPCSLLPAPYSLKPKNLYLTQIAIFNP